jgi:6,7-dimethyl-8-ribityllumazine synthase
MTRATTAATGASPAERAAGGGKRIAFVQARWHNEVVDSCRVAFAGETERLGLPATAVDRFEVPGAFEIPLHAQRLARTGAYAAVVGAALVVDGGIYRHDFVADTVVQALMRVQLDTDVPVLSVVLTPHHFHEHAVHTDFFRHHFEVKGAEVARACVATLDSLERLPGSAAA